jgi:hypothetical protein
LFFLLINLKHRYSNKAQDYGRYRTLNFLFFDDEGLKNNPLDSTFSIWVWRKQGYDIAFHRSQSLTLWTSRWHHDRESDPQEHARFHAIAYFQFVIGWLFWRSVWKLRLLF